MNFKELKKELLKENIKINDEHIHLFDLFLNNLIETNKVMNLTAITEKEEMIEKHLYDSLLTAKFIKDYGTFADVGSGGGFPGIPLSIIFPNVEFTLIEPITKKANYLTSTVAMLGLKNVTVINKRSEDLLELRETFDFVSARAVAPLNILLEICTPLLKVNGHFIALKGSKANEEILASKDAIKKLDLELINSTYTKLPCCNENRCFIDFLKIRQTNKKYPRPYSLIKNRPL